MGWPPPPSPASVCGGKLQGEGGEVGVSFVSLVGCDILGVERDAPEPLRLVERRVLSHLERIMQL